MKTEFKISALEIKAGGKGRTLLQNANKNLEGGNLIALVGLNGSGKSTLINCICGFEKPFAGNVSINGNDIHKMSVTEKSKLISIVFSSQELLEWMDVETYLSLGRSPYTNHFDKLEKNDIEVIENIIEITGLTPLKNNFMNQLSDGEKQRCFIARALIQDTPIILLDEPTAFLDVRNKLQIMDLLKDISAKHQKIIILSTHDISLAKKVSNEIWWLDNLELKSVSPENFSEEVFY